jgi:RNA recognition motif-containing protein
MMSNVLEEFFSMPTNIYVGNLSFKTTETELEHLFSQFGPVSHVNIIQDRETGRSRGFGFVEMESEHANVAISTLDGTELDGRSLRVNVAREKERTRRPPMRRDYNRRAMY